MKKMSVVLDETLIERAKIQAIREKRSLAELVGEVVAEYLKRASKSEYPREL